MYLFTITNFLNQALSSKLFSKSNHRTYSMSRINSYLRCFLLSLSRVKRIASKSNVIFSSNSIEHKYV